MFVDMEVKLTWFERMEKMSVEECLPLGDTPAATIYSAIHFNKETIKEKGMKFRVQKDNESGQEYVCRIK